MTSYAFVNDSGVTELRGTLVPDPGVAIHTQESLAGTATAVADDGTASFSWAASSGDALLDVSAPTLPTIIATGTYTFNLSYTTSGLTVGGYFVARIELDVSGADFFYQFNAAKATAKDDSVAALFPTLFLTAGMEVKASVVNRDGASARDFSLVAIVQRLS